MTVTDWPGPRIPPSGTWIVWSWTVALTGFAGRGDRAQLHPAEARRDRVELEPVDRAAGVVPQPDRRRRLERARAEVQRSLHVVRRGQGHGRRVDRSGQETGPGARRDSPARGFAEHQLRRPGAARSWSPERARARESGRASARAWERQRGVARRPTPMARSARPDPTSTTRPRARRGRRSGRWRRRSGRGDPRDRDGRGSGRVTALARDDATAASRNRRPPDRRGARGTMRRRCVDWGRDRSVDPERAIGRRPVGVPRRDQGRAAGPEAPRGPGGPRELPQRRDLLPQGRPAPGRGPADVDRRGRDPRPPLRGAPDPDRAPRRRHRAERWRRRDRGRPDDRADEDGPDPRDRPREPRRRDPARHPQRRAEEARRRGGPVLRSGSRELRDLLDRREPRDERRRAVLREVRPDPRLASWASRSSSPTAASSGPAARTSRTPPATR